MISLPGATDEYGGFGIVETNMHGHGRSSSSSYNEAGVRRLWHHTSLMNYRHRRRVLLSTLLAAVLAGLPGALQTTASAENASTTSSTTLQSNHSSSNTTNSSNSNSNSSDPCGTDAFLIGSGNTTACIACTLGALLRCSVEHACGGLTFGRYSTQCMNSTDTCALLFQACSASTSSIASDPRKAALLRVRAFACSTTRVSVSSNPCVLLSPTPLLFFSFSYHTFCCAACIWVCVAPCCRHLVQCRVVTHHCKRWHQRGRPSREHQEATAGMV